jgi:hypothetical protein
VKLNIHIPVSGQARELALHINAELNARGHNEINFGQPENHLPHVTLYMGHFQANGDVSKLVERLASSLGWWSHFP